MKVFTPDVRKDRVTEITAETLRALGVKGVVVDLDNTLGGYEDPLPPEDVIAWAASVKDAGFGLCIVSNNSHKERVSAYGEALVKLGADEVLAWLKEKNERAAPETVEAFARVQYSTPIRDFKKNLKKY